MAASVRATRDDLGASVAIAGDTIVAGASQSHVDPVAGTAGPGAAYVFVKPAGGWASGTETAKLTALGAGSNQVLGWSVALSGDTLVAGNNGAVYVFGQAPASITVTKQLLPACDPGRFDLKVAGTVVKAGAGNGGGGLRGLPRHLPGIRERGGGDEPVQLLHLNRLHDQWQPRPDRRRNHPGRRNATVIPAPPATERA